MEENGMEGLEGWRLTGLESVIIPAKVNVYRFRGANEGHCSLIDGTGQCDWLIAKLNGL